MSVRKIKLWSILAGIAAGSAVSITAFLTIGVYLLFRVFYGCAPQHRVQPDPDPCSSIYMVAWTIGVFAAAIAIFVVTLVVVRRAVSNRLSPQQP
ncbi:hypothetical protein ACNI3Q_07380 [Sphingomonas sp. FW199]|uniref:hypothetical protein n=1 Tax=Sphingomonas sp. FW199 TaxID=3400217 RepID=UPI003CF496CD